MRHVEDIVQWVGGKCVIKADTIRFEKRLELLKEKVQEGDFLTAKGLGNEVPFWIFDYPPEKELYFTPPQLELFKSLKPQCERRLMLLFVGDIGLVLPLEKSAVYAGAEYSRQTDYRSDRFQWRYPVDVLNRGG